MNNAKASPTYLASDRRILWALHKAYYAKLKPLKKAIYTQFLSEEFKTKVPGLGLGCEGKEIPVLAMLAILAVSHVAPTLRWRYLLGGQHSTDGVVSSRADPIGSLELRSTAASPPVRHLTSYIASPPSVFGASRRPRGSKPSVLLAHQRSSKWPSASCRMGTARSGARSDLLTDPPTSHATEPTQPVQLAEPHPRQGFCRRRLPARLPTKPTTITYHLVCVPGIEALPEGRTGRRDQKGGLGVTTQHQVSDAADPLPLFLTFAHDHLAALQKERGPMAQR